MGAAAIKYQLILTTSTGSLAGFHTRHNHFVLYQGYEGMYRRLCLCADNESTKQSPESIPAAQGINSNDDDDESVCHYLDSSLLGSDTRIVRTQVQGTVKATWRDQFQIPGNHLEAVRFDVPKNTAYAQIQVPFCTMHKYSLYLCIQGILFNTANRTSFLKSCASCVNVLRQYPPLIFLGFFISGGVWIIPAAFFFT